MKIKLKNKYTKISILSSIFFVCLSINADALRTEPYRAPGQKDGFYDKDVPSAIILLEAGDGMDAGTVLYRHIHEDIDYYSPVTPQQIKGTSADVNNGKYDNWGPWDMPGNKKSHNVKSTRNYTYAKTTKTVTIYTNISETSNNHKNIGTLPANTELTVLSRWNPTNLLFFDLSPFPSLASKSSTGVGMIKLNNGGVSLSGEQYVMHSGWENKTILQNFKKMAKYGNNASTDFKNLENGRYVNPAHAPADVRGKFGEWRLIGYNAQGEPLDNPYFPADELYYTGNSAMWGYPWRLTPWNPNDREDSVESDTQEAYAEFSYGKTGFPYDNGSFDYHKKEAVKRLHAMGQLKPSSPDDSTLMNMVRRLSLQTHPVKQSIIFNGQDKRSAHNRTAFLPNYNLRDLYVHSIVVIDEETNSVVATYNGTLAGKAPYTTGTIQKGRTYVAKVYLANGANSDMLVTSLQSQIGFTYNSSAVNMDMPFGSTYNTQASIRGNKGGIKGTTGSKSESFDFRFSVDSSQTGHIDLYGFVGKEHQGVDNLTYTNDVGAIRLYIGSMPPPPVNTSCTITNGGNTKICGGGDLRPLAIKIFSKTENGKLVYQHNYGESSPVTQSAMIPGYEYRVVYNGIYEGTTILEYDWIPGRDDNPDTPEDEYVPGRWGPGKTKEYEVPMNYYIEKYSGGPRDLDTISKTDKMFYVVPDPNKRDDLTIPMVNGVMMGYYADIMMYQHPYLKTKMDIKMSDSRVNSNKDNDSFEIMLKDNFDISINNLRVTPVVSHVSGGGDTVNYNVTYDAELNTPSYVSSSNYQASINTAININGKVFYVKDQLVKGTDGNKNITHVIENVPVPSSGPVNVLVNLNYDKMSYETGNYDNNIGSTNVNIVKVKDPTLGNPSDTVKTPDGINSNNPNKGGDANDNCLTPRTRNTWTSTHRKFSWNSNVVNYNKISNGDSVSFNKYYTDYEKLNEATETYSEDYGIQKILFRSKDTKDKKYGIDGWVNLLNPSERDLAIIKAGYGFELQIVTKYSTDALTKRTWNISNNGSSGTAVSALNSKPNYGLEDVFLELPGTESTRKILSSTGYGGTVLGLNVSKSVNNNTGNATWTYSIKPTNTLGVGETAKIYIPSETKDGDYKLKIYTPPVSGAGSVNKKNYSALCDRKEVTIKVKGSAMNDLNSHETQ